LGSGPGGWSARPWRPAPGRCGLAWSSQPGFRGAGRVPGGRARRPAARRQRLLPYAVARLPVRVAGRAGCLTLWDPSSRLLADVLSDVGINAFSVMKGRTDYPNKQVIMLFRIL